MRSVKPAISVVAAALVLLWAALQLSRSFTREFSWLMYGLVTFAVSLDLLDICVRLYLRHAGIRSWRPKSTVTQSGTDASGFTTYQKRVHLRPYAVVVSVYNMAHDLDDFLAAMAPHKERLWVIDDGSTDQTVATLRQAGIRCIEGGVNRKKPGAIKKLLTSLPPEMETVVVLDPDIDILNQRSADFSTLDEVIFDFQNSGAAALCPRIRIEPEGLMARFQALEYCMSFSFGRASMGTLNITSGASIYRRSALESALRQHSLSVYAEDLENATMLLSSGEEIYYEPRLIFQTGGKPNLSGWMSQRVGWSYGLIKVYAANLNRMSAIAARGPGAAYQYLVYLGCVSLLLHPLRVVSGVLLLLSLLRGLDDLFALHWMPGWTPEGAYFLSAYLKYSFLAVVGVVGAVPAGERLHVAGIAPLYFFYSLAHMIPVTFGYANWFSLRLFGSRVWQDHYQSEESIKQPATQWDEEGVWT